MKIMNHLKEPIDLTHHASLGEKECRERPERRRDLGQCTGCRRREVEVDLLGKLQALAYGYERMEGNIPDRPRRPSATRP
jgi:hypothetical protein